MKNAVVMALVSTLTTWSFTAQAGEFGQEFTLHGIDYQRPSQTCFLYVDQMGNQPKYGWPNKFYAIVRTSFDPQKSYHLVALSKSEMTTIDKRGRPTAELKVRLRSPAGPESLHRALSFQGRSPLSHWRIACGKLQPLE